MRNIWNLPWESFFFFYTPAQVLSTNGQHVASRVAVSWRCVRTAGRRARSDCGRLGISWAPSLQSVLCIDIYDSKWILHFASSIFALKQQFLQLKRCLWNQHLDCGKLLFTALGFYINSVKLKKKKKRRLSFTPRKKGELLVHHMSNVWHMQSKGVGSTGSGAPWDYRGGQVKPGFTQSSQPSAQITRWPKSMVMLCRWTNDKTITPLHCRKIQSLYLPTISLIQLNYIQRTGILIISYLH